MNLNHVFSSYCILSYFPAAVLTHSGKINLREKAFILSHNLVVWFIINGKSRQSKFEACSHVTFTVSKERGVNACVMLNIPSPHYISNHLLMECLPIIMMGLPTTWLMWSRCMLSHSTVLYWQFLLISCVQYFIVESSS